MDSLRQNARQVVNEARYQYVSPYEEWSVEELKELLVEYQIPLRDSANATHEILVRICDEVFGADIADSESSKELRRQLSIEDVVHMETAARMIQRAYFRRQALKRQLRLQKHQHQHQRSSSSSSYDYDYDCEGGSYTYYDDDALGSTSDDVVCSQESFRRHSMLRRINERGDDYDEEIEIEWRKPSWKFAKRFERSNRPHRSGQGMDKYDWMSVTSGRHCFATGCGEQFDLWDEGRTSEFSTYGSGVTNYFKFVKWSCWVMLILSTIHLPVLFINLLGTNELIGLSLNAAMTTFANLGSAGEVESVTIPGCDAAEFNFDRCEVSKDRLAEFFAYVDVAGTVFFVLAWLWLRKFEGKESRVLNRSTVSASDYTIRLMSVPEDATELELAHFFAELTGEAVAAVHLAFNNGKEIASYIQRGKVMQQRYKCIQRIRYEKTVNSNGYKKRLRKLMREREDLTLSVRQKDEKRSKIVVKGKQCAIQAFVTFETETGFVKAMANYNLSWIRRNCCCYPTRLLFKGSRVDIDQAPQPSTILWENLEYTSGQRLVRKCLTTSVALLAILFSVYITFLARDYKGEVLHKASRPCPIGFFEQDPAYQLKVVEQDLDLSHCYCRTLSIFKQWSINQCHDHLLTSSQATATSYAAGLIVVFTNIFFTILMDRAGRFEKHHSLDEMEASNMVRVFLLKFVNTGCIVLFYGQTWLQRLVGVQFSDASDLNTFGVEWYATGGTSLITVMLLNIFAPHAGTFVAYFRHRTKIRRLENNLTEDMETSDSHKVWHSQEELNEFYRGPNFRLNYRYSQVLVTMFVCWMYAISMPLMPMLGAISCYISYWVDKFLFCNFYKAPPMYSDAMGKKSTILVGCLVLLHTLMSMWMLGSEEIFQGVLLLGEYPSNLDMTTSSLQVKLSKKHLFPLQMTIIAFGGYIVSTNISKSFIRRLCGCLRCLTCSSRSGEIRTLKKNMNTVQVNYSSARDRDLMKGLSTYNILQNPTYQEAFAITPEFAASHNRVASIRGFNTKEGDLSVAQNYKTTTNIVHP